MIEMLNNVSYDTLQTLSLFAYVFAFIAFIVAAAVLINAAGGIKGIKTRLKKGKSMKTPEREESETVPDSRSISEMLEDGYDDPKPERSGEEAVKINETAPRNEPEPSSVPEQAEETETELLDQPKEKKNKFRVIKTIMVTHEEDASEDNR